MPEEKLPAWIGKDRDYKIDRRVLDHQTAVCQKQEDKTT